MTTFQLDNFGVSELNSVDASEITGGSFWGVLGAALGVAAAICGLIAALVY